MADQQWNVLFSSLTFTKIIGKGNFGRVYKGKLGDREVAIKQLFYLEDVEMQKYIEREISVLKNLHHPHIVQCLGLCKSDEGIFIVTEFIRGGDLRSKLKNPKQELPWSLRVKILMNVAKAIEYLHSKKLIHRDLKSMNLLVADGWDVKVCDFGFARQAGAKADYLTMCGTDEWMAPEVGLGERYDERADVFSFGMIVCELITRRKPPARAPGRAFAFELAEFKKRCPEDTPRVLFDMALECAAFYPEQRPSMTAVIPRLEKLLVQLRKVDAKMDISRIPMVPADEPAESDDDQDSSEDNGDEIESENQNYTYGGVVEED